MNTFTFKAKRANGQLVSGKLKAKNKNEVLYLLANKKLEPIFVDVQKNIFSRGSGGVTVGTKHLVTFTRQLAFLINSGVPLVQSLQIVKEIVTSTGLRVVVGDLIDSIQKGNTFGASLAAYPSVFGGIYISIIESGELGGILDTMLTRLAEYIEEDEKLKGRVKKALMYPIFVLTISMIIVAVIMVVVVPKFAALFASSNAELPFMTQILMSTSDFMRNNVVLLLIGLIFLPFVFIMYLRSDSGRSLRDQILLVIPVFGPLVLKNSLARFSRTLSCLLSGGVSISEALGAASMTSNNFLVEQATQRVKAQVIKGKSVAQSLRKEPIIPVLIPNMVAIGEETGNMDATLEKVAEFYEEQVTTTTNAISDLIQPLLIVVLGGIIGFIVISLYLPIFKLPGVAI